MKKLYTTLLCALALISSNTNAQVQLLPSCNPPAELLERYDDDIRAMAAEYAWQANLPDTANIAISPALYDFVADGLAAIYNSNSPATDSVFNKYCIQDENESYRSRQTTIFCDKNQPWVIAWRSGQTLSGNTFLDSLFAAHDLEVTSVIVDGADCWVDVESPVGINMRALAFYLKQVPGINYVFPLGLMGDGNSMRFSSSGNLRTYRFTLSWGPCPTGCTEHYNWDFQVDNNCEVVYLGADLNLYADLQMEHIPAPQNCNLFLSAAETVSEPLIQLFPNPTSGTVHIQTEAPLTNLKLYNATGSCVLQQPNGVELNVSHLPTGLYYFSGTDARGKVHTRRLVKN